jgi:hypothetical protein
MNELATAAQDFYLTTMLTHGYGSEKPQYKEYADLPGQKTLLYSKGKFTLTDTYFNAKGVWSAGQTLILMDGELAWHMYYEGVYQDDALPLLKGALHEEWRSGQFTGGRGRHNFSTSVENGKLTYYNYQTPGSTFLKFSGHERIQLLLSGSRSSPDDMRGQHMYRGRWFLKG